MKEHYKVLFLIDYFDSNAGASGAIKVFTEFDPQISDYQIICTRIGNIYDKINLIKVKTVESVCKIIQKGDFDFIHYFKSAGYEVFDLTAKALDILSLKIPILTTVCQQPNIINLLLSPLEIKRTDIFVFIDKTAFNCPLVSFIDSAHKRMSYLGHNEKEIALTGEMIINRRKIKHKPFIFGRGSTINKCHKDFIEIYNKIKIDEKKFVIVGIKNPEDFHIIQEDIEVMGVLPYEEWLSACNEFDVFLYILPEDAYSSIDATLGHAMLLEKAVVYYGPAAPKERFYNGLNGLVVEKIEEIPNLCEKLYENPDWAKSIGRRARETTITDFSFKTTLNKYHIFYMEVLMSKQKQNISIPIDYYILFYKKNGKRILKKYIKSVLKWDKN